MLVGFMLFYVGATLGINGIWLIGEAHRARLEAAGTSGDPSRHPTHIAPAEVSIINFFAAGIGAVSATVLVVFGALHDDIDSIADAAFIMLFAFTYLFVALNQIHRTGDHGLGWFCLFIAITAVPIAVQILGHAEGNAGSVWLGIDWFVWALLWFAFFVLLTLERKIARFVGWFALATAIGTAWMLGYAVLQGFVTL